MLGIIALLSGFDCALASQFLHKSFQQLEQWGESSQQSCLVGTEFKLSAASHMLICSVLFVSDLLKQWKWPVQLKVLKNESARFSLISAVTWSPSPLALLLSLGNFTVVYRAVKKLLQATVDDHLCKIVSLLLFLFVVFTPLYYLLVSTTVFQNNSTSGLAESLLLLTVYWEWGIHGLTLTCCDLWFKVRATVSFQFPLKPCDSIYGCVGVTRGDQRLDYILAVLALLVQHVPTHSDFRVWF